MASKNAQARNDLELLQECLHGYAQDEHAHKAFISKVEKRYKAYRGVMEIRSKAAGWTSKLHPPYVLQVIESMVANVIDPRPGWKVRSRPRIDSVQEIEQLALGAKANELLLAQQADSDHLGEKQVVFAKQAYIAGLSAYKTFWRYSERHTSRQAVIKTEVLDDHGNLVGYQPRLGVESGVQVAHDDATAEVVDVRDLIWHEAAISIDKAQRITHRVLYSMEELRQMQAQGLISNVDRIEADGAGITEYSSREQDLFQSDRGKDMVEVLEQWRRTSDGIRVTLIANRNVLLSDRPNPFWHGQYPFVICSAMPDLFRIPGVSEVEVIMDLQEMAWQLQNQRLDNLSLLNNAIVLIRDDVDDYDQFDWAPGAQWIVSDPNQVSTLQVATEPATISLEAENIVKQDLQNIPGASPTLLGQMDPTQQTATEITTVTTLAMRRVAVKRQQFRYCHGRLGGQWLALNQQFVREDRLLEEIGPGGKAAYMHIHPMLLGGHGDYYIDLEPMDESLIRQERKAEAQSTFQVALSAAPVFAALAQAGQAPMLNMKAFMDDVLEAAGISDKDKYYNAEKPPQLPVGPHQPGQAGAQSPTAQGQMAGVTAPQATDQNAPSNAFSQSPIAALQRMAAMAGGPANAPNG